MWLEQLEQYKPQQKQSPPGPRSPPKSPVPPPQVPGPPPQVPGPPIRSVTVDSRNWVLECSMPMRHTLESTVRGSAPFPGPCTQLPLPQPPRVDTRYPLSQMCSEVGNWDPHTALIAGTRWRDPLPRAWRRGPRQWVTRLILGSEGRKSGEHDPEVSVQPTAVASDPQEGADGPGPGAGSGLGRSWLQGTQGQLGWALPPGGAAAWPLSSQLCEGGGGAGSPAVHPRGRAENPATPSFFPDRLLCPSSLSPLHGGLS